MEKRIHKKKGVTLVEVMVAIIIFIIVILGGFVFFFYGRGYIAHSNHQRIALELTKEKIEMWKASGYGSLVNQNEPSIPLGGIQFSRTTVVVDGTGGSVYREITVTTSWQEAGNPYSVTIVTIIAQ